MGNGVEMIFAMATVVLTWIALAAALVGLGLAVRALVRRAVPAAGSPIGPSVGETTVLFWVGYAASAAVLQIWHCFLPIGGAVSGLLLAAGWAAFAAFGRSVARRFGAGLRHRPLAGISLGLIVLWAAMHALGPGNAHDSGTYHYAVIQWLNREAIVPGLGNLAVTFAHNSAHLLLAAAIDVGPWDGRSEHVLNGLLVFAMAPLAIRGLTRATKGGTSIHWYDALLIVPIVGTILAKDISSPKTDAAPAFLILLMVRTLVLLLRHTKADHLHRRAWLTVQLAALGATAFIVKLSAAPFVAALAVMVGVLWVRDRAAAGTRWRTVLLSASIGVVLVAPWMVRNVVLSGYPLFPKRVAAFETDWTIPSDRFDAFDFGVQSKATLPRLGYRAMDRLLPVPDRLRFELQRGDPVSAGNWIPGWLVTLPANSPVAILVPLLLAAGSAFLVALRRPRVAVPRAPLLALLPVGAALAFWFVSAPDPRYGIGLTWALAGLGLAFAVGSRFAAGSPARPVVLAIAVTFGLVAAVGWGVVAESVRGDSERVRGDSANPLLTTLLEHPGPDHGFHPRPRVEAIVWVSRHGVVIRRPAIGPRIWAEEQPAVGWPAPSDDLAYRDPEDLSVGFRIDTAAAGP